MASKYRSKWLDSRRFSPILSRCFFSNRHELSACFKISSHHRYAPRTSNTAKLQPLLANTAHEPHCKVSRPSTSMPAALKELLVDFPLGQILVVCLVRFAEPMAFTSFLPYVYNMVKDFDVTADEAQIARYAGYLAACFCICEVGTSFLWGHFSDKHGRKPTLMIGLVGSIVSLLILGFATHYHWALFARSLMGLLNGNVTVIRTVIGEIATKRKHQALAFSTMPIVWQIGSVIGPLIGGYLPQPRGEVGAQRWPFVEKYPYALPNIVLCGLLFGSLLVALFCLEETHHRHKYRRDPFVNGFDKVRKKMGRKVKRRPWHPPEPEETPLLQDIVDTITEYVNPTKEFEMDKSKSQPGDQNHEQHGPEHGDEEEEVVEVILNTEGQEVYVDEHGEEIPEEELEELYVEEYVVEVPEEELEKLIDDGCSCQGGRDDEDVKKYDPDKESDSGSTHADDEAEPENDDKFDRAVGFAVDETAKVIKHVAGSKVGVLSDLVADVTDKAAEAIKDYVNTDEEEEEKVMDTLKDSEAITTGITLYIQSGNNVCSGATLYNSKATSEGKVKKLLDGKYLKTESSTPSETPKHEINLLPSVQDERVEVLKLNSPESEANPANPLADKKTKDSDHGLSGYAEFAVEETAKVFRKAVESEGITGEVIADVVDKAAEAVKEYVHCGDDEVKRVVMEAAEEVKEESKEFTKKQYNEDAKIPDIKVEVANQTELTEVKNSKPVEENDDTFDEYVSFAVDEAAKVVKKIAFKQPAIVSEVIGDIADKAAEVVKEYINTDDEDEADAVADPCQGTRASVDHEIGTGTATRAKQEQKEELVVKQAVNTTDVPTEKSIIASIEAEPESHTTGSEATQSKKKQTEAVELVFGKSKPDGAEGSVTKATEVKEVKAGKDNEDTSDEYVNFAVDEAVKVVKKISAKQPAVVSEVIADITDKAAEVIKDYFTTGKEDGTQPETAEAEIKENCVPETKAGVTLFVGPGIQDGAETSEEGIADGSELHLESQETFQDAEEPVEVKEEPETAIIAPDSINVKKQTEEPKPAKNDDDMFDEYVSFATDEVAKVVKKLATSKPGIVGEVVADISDKTAEAIKNYVNTDEEDEVSELGDVESRSELVVMEVGRGSVVQQEIVAGATLYNEHDSNNNADATKPADQSAKYKSERETGRDEDEGAKEKEGFKKEEESDGGHLSDYAEYAIDTAAKVVKNAVQSRADGAALSEVIDQAAEYIKDYVNTSDKGKVVDEVEEDFEGEKINDREFQGASGSVDITRNLKEDFTDDQSIEFPEGSVSPVLKVVEKEAEESLGTADAESDCKDDDSALSFGDAAESAVDEISQVFKGLAKSKPGIVGEVYGDVVDQLAEYIKDYVNPSDEENRPRKEDTKEEGEKIPVHCKGSVGNPIPVSELSRISTDKTEVRMDSKRNLDTSITHKPIVEAASLSGKSNATISRQPVDNAHKLVNPLRKYDAEHGIATPRDTQIRSFNQVQAQEEQDSDDDIRSVGKLISKSHSERLISQSRAKKSDSLQGSFREIMTPGIITALCCGFILSLHSVVVDEFLPVFLSYDVFRDESNEIASKFPLKVSGGLSYSTEDIGSVLSTTGGLGVFVMCIIFPYFDRNYDCMSTYKNCVRVFPFIYFLLPYVVFLADTPWLAKFTVYFLSCLKAAAVSIATPQILLIIHNSSKPDKRAMVNGLNISVTELARFIGPMVWGGLMSLGQEKGAAWIGWWSLGVISLIAVFQSGFLHSHRHQA